MSNTTIRYIIRQTEAQRRMGSDLCPIQSASKPIVFKTIGWLAKVTSRQARVGPEKYTHCFVCWHRQAQGSSEQAQSNKTHDLLVGRGRPKAGPSRPRAINLMICSLATVCPRQARVGTCIEMNHNESTPHEHKQSQKMNDR